MKFIKKTYDLLANMIISTLLSIIIMVGLFALLSPFSESASKGMTFIKNLYFFFVIEHVVFSLIVVIGIMVFIIPRVCRGFLNE